MPCLLSEIHFWSFIDDILIQHTDYGVFRYYSKKDATDSVYISSKRSYCEHRGVYWNVVNKRPTKLKNKLKELEDLLLQNKVVFSDWENSNIQLLLSRGIRIIINVNQVTSDINSITFDKSLMTKIQNECIYDAVVSQSHIICATSEGRIIGHGNKWQDGWFIECGCKRKLSSFGELLVIWGRTGADNPQPWSPLTKEHQKANLHVYWVGARGPDLLTYKKTDGEPISVVVSKLNTKTIIIVEQKVSQRGAVSVELSVLVLVSNSLKRASITAVPLQTQVSCCALSQNENSLILGCIDGSVAILDRYRGSTKITKASFIPTLVTWNVYGAVAALSNEKGQVQYFDTALNCLKVQLLNEESAAAQIIDLSVYFNIQPTIDVINWDSKDLLIIIENGPIIVVSHLGNSLGFLALIQRYLNLGKIDKAIALLLSWNWNEQCFRALQRIVMHLMNLPLTEENTQYLQKALGSYHSPNVPLNAEIRHMFGSQVKAITRRFFHQLVRNKKFETAFLLAVDLAHHDLFMDLHFIAVKIGETEMAAAARAQASALLSRCSSAESACSRSSCSQCSTDSSSSEDLNACSDNHLQHTFDTIQNIQPPINDNYLTTNFNSVTPKTYKPPSIPPIPNVDLPKINFTKPFLSKSTVLHKNGNTNFPLIPPPLPIAPPPPPPKTTTSVETYLGSLSINSNYNNNQSYSNSSLHLQPFSALNTTFENQPFYQYSQPCHTNYFPNYPNSTLALPKYSSPLPPPTNFDTNPSPTQINSTYSDANKSNQTPSNTHLQQIASPLQLSSSTSSFNSCANSSPSLQNTNTAKKQQAKVKFSDTVTAFIVPEIKRPVRPPPPAHVTDPQKELADSLPLCHPNEDYLKDFTPVQRSDSVENPGPSKIKVVHFGVV